ncbi:MAG: RNA polymerase sigma factor [Rhodopirellula sp. JB053]
MSPHTQSFAVLSNAALVDRCQHQDDAAFTEIFRRHRQMVYRVCLRYLGHHHDAEDVTQETFRRAAMAIPRVDSRRPLEPWLVTIAANRCRTFLSRRSSDRTHDQLDEALPAVQSRTDVERILSLDEQIKDALGRLPDNQRRAFELIHRKELSYPEAASVMGRSTGTIKTWVRRAKLTMQHVLAGEVNPAPSQTSPATHRSAAKVAATSVAMVLVMGGLWMGSAAQKDHASVSEKTSAGAAFAANQPSETTPSPHSHLALGTPVDDRDQATSPVIPGFTPESASNVDWQFVSLQSFSRARFAVDDIQALPVAEWVEGTTPTIVHLKSGIEPLGKTLRRVACLFQCDLAASRPSPAAINLPNSVPSFESLDANEPGLSGDLRLDTSLTRPTLAGSVS